MTEKSKNVKSRNWAFVAYPESVPKNWLELLRQTGIPIAISPLHNADKNADESEKKPHWHIIVSWGNGSATFNMANNIAKSINGTAPIQLQQVKGYYRYLTHKDNPEKAQYSESDIICLNGFNIADYVKRTNSEIVQMKVEVLDFIRCNEISEYQVLIDDLQKQGLFELLDLASCNTLFFNNYLKSKRHRKG